jgi:long-subunit acyl-CoA synthetase (AMP-forming)
MSKYISLRMGEIPHTKGPCVMMGYYKDPEKT